MALRYVYSETVSSLKAISEPYLAVSCFDPDGFASGAVGFEATEYSLAIRNALLQRSWTFDGRFPSFVGNAWASAGVPFCRMTDYPNQKSRVVTRVLGTLMPGRDDAEIPSGVLQEIAELQDSSDDLRSDYKTLEALSKLHLRHGLEMQLWPYNTSYESHFLYFGATEQVLTNNLVAFFLSHNITLEKTDSDHFPRY